MIRPCILLIFCIFMIHSNETTLDTHDNHNELIVVLDFGSQYSQLIARRVRDSGVYCIIKPYTISDTELKAYNPAGIILSGSPASVLDEKSPRIPLAVFSIGCPVLGICYGMQAMAMQLGGSVARGIRAEFGHAILHREHSCPLYENVANDIDVWMSHGDHVISLPEGFRLVAHSQNSPIASMEHVTKKLYGIQFHPEVSHTPDGMQIVRNFITNICQCKRSWNSHYILETLVRDIQRTVGNDHVLVAVSGGVDSSVLAALLHKAIGNQLHCVFVDHGLLRLGEAEQVRTIFQRLDIPLTSIDARDHFLHALQNISDPEQKRSIIGKEFITIFENESHNYANIKWLAQGTIYSDVIESAFVSTSSGQTSCIKSHHNVGGLPAVMKLPLLEPLRTLFKDEVRNLGILLGLPHDIIYRHPFPGPGFAIRIMGPVTQESLRIATHADAILIDELYKHNLYHTVSQAFAVFLPIKTVGVKGDKRCYENVIALRAVESVDFMTAQWAHVPYDVLQQVAMRILNEVSGVARVVYDISHKPPATIEWE